MEIMCTHTLILDNELEVTFSKFVAKFGDKINNGNIESYHCVGCHTIAEFSHKKDYQQLMKVKEGLSKLNLTDINLGNTKNIY